jgi:hypothetical protein
MSGKALSAAGVLLIVVFLRGSARADRPGSYDIIDGTNTAPPGAPNSPDHGGHPRPGSPGCEPSGQYHYRGVPWYPHGYQPYGYPGYGYGWYGPTGIYYNPGMNQLEYWLPPVYAPAELAYGPLAAARFFGYSGYVIPPARPVQSSPDLPRAATAEEIADRLRKSNPEARERGFKFVDYGDALFRQQRFHEALQRYKSAIEAAPDLAEAYHRQGFALIATGRYELAAKAFKISLQLDPAVVYKVPKLELLYGGSNLAKEAHLEALADRALNRGGDPDVLFLVGMFLHADGQPDRAKKFLSRAAAAAGPGGSFLQPLFDPKSTPAAGAAARGTSAPIKT